MAAKKGGLGKGLAALIPAVPAGGATATEEPEVSRETETIRPAPEPRSGSTDVDGPAASAVEAEATDAIDIDDFDVDDIETDYVEPTVSRETEDESEPEEQQQEDLVPVPGATFRLVPLDEITMNPRQPRQVFDEDELVELKTSLAEVGLLQPIAVRELDSGYELILGERRTRAARDLGWETIPALVRETRDDELLRDALLENIHRVQLNPLEEGAAYQQLLDEFGVTQEELSKRIGRSRPQISNTIRLLSLPGSVQRRVAAGVLSAGHARAILSLGQEERQDAVATRIVAEGLSVRATEELVSLELAENRDDEAEDVSRETSGAKRAAKLQAPGLADLADRLSEHFDTRVKVSLGQKKGRIVIEFGSVADLERIAESMGIDSTPEQSDQL